LGIAALGLLALGVIYVLARQVRSHREAVRRFGRPPSPWAANRAGPPASKRLPSWA